MTNIINNLPHILEEHRKWRLGEGGARAYLRGADLGGAYLRGADLGDADFGGAYLRGADLGGADIIDGGQRRDGYRFVGWIKDGALMIRAGCRNMTVAEYRDHNARREDAKMRDETASILDHIERVARVRGLIVEAVS